MQAICINVYEATKIDPKRARRTRGSGSFCCPDESECEASYSPQTSWLLAYWYEWSCCGHGQCRGITRLTRSGLSMTDWKLQGTLPPMTAEEWNIEFERYKQFPEWQQRKNMTMDEFKWIFFWEYGHRMMGRSLGFAFAGPLMYFGLRGMIPRHMYGRMALLFSLGGTQGLIGWWMVKSGLGERYARVEEGDSS